MFSPDQVPSKIEQIADGSMGGDESLRLAHRFESPHPTLSNPGRLVGLLSAVILILFGTVDRFRNQLPVGHPVTSQLVSYDFPGFASMRSYQPPEEAFCSCASSLGLEIDIHDFTVPKALRGAGSPDPRPAIGNAAYH